MERTHWKTGDTFRYGSHNWPNTFGVVCRDAGPGENVEIEWIMRDAELHRLGNVLFVNSGRTLMEYIEHTDDDATGFKGDTPEPENIPADEDPLQQQLARAHAIAQKRMIDDLD